MTRQHPAHAVTCPTCGAHNRASCTALGGRIRLLDPHPARVAAWAQATAVCPTCQVAPGTPCHQDGRQLDDVHAARYTEAEGTAA